MYATGTIHLHSWSWTCWKAILFEKLLCTKSPLVRSEVLWVSHSKISMGMWVLWYPLVRRTSTVQVQSSFGLLQNVLGKILKHTPSSYTHQLMRCSKWKLTWLGQNQLYMCSYMDDRQSEKKIFTPCTCTVRAPFTFVHRLGPAGKQFCLKNCLVQYLYW